MLTFTEHDVYSDTQVATTDDNYSVVIVHNVDPDTYPGYHVAIYDDGDVYGAFEPIAHTEVDAPVATFAEAERWAEVNLPRVRARNARS